MARIRTIKPQFFTSEDVTALAPLARLLFIGLFTECDRDGRVEDRHKTLKMRLLPGDDVDVDALLWSLVDGGLIRRYEAADGVAVIQVKAFTKHQKPHPKEADSVLPAKGRDREKPHLNTASREQVAVLPVEHPSSPHSSLREGVSLREGAAGTRTAAAPLIMNSLQFERRKQQCVYVGARLEVPHSLHAELRKLLGGSTAETDLLGWYADLDAEIEASSEAILPDVFRWLKARFSAWAQRTGESVESVVARIEAKQAARKGGVS